MIFITVFIRLGLIVLLPFSKESGSVRILVCDEVKYFMEKCFKYMCVCVLMHVYVDMALHMWLLAVSVCSSRYWRNW